MSTFRGFPAEGMQFFKKLKKNNTREWFLEHKAEYEEHVKAPMEQFVAALNAKLMDAAPTHVTDPKKAIYRLYRDTRFSKDKTPYKTHVAATFRHNALDKHASAGLYVGVSPEQIEVAGGVYMPGPDEIPLLRNLFAEKHETIAKLANTKSFKALLGEWQGQQLKRIPRGFPEDHPAEALLRRKQWYFYVTLDPSIATTPKLFQEIWKRFQVAIPMLEILNQPILQNKRKN